MWLFGHNQWGRSRSPKMRGIALVYLSHVALQCIYIYRKVPSERPHPCNRPPPPPPRIFFRLKDWYHSSAPPRPIMSIYAVQLILRYAYALALRRCRNSRRTPWSTSSGCFAGIKIYNGENMHATARHFGIDRKCLREWLEKADRLRDNQVGVAKKKRKLNAGKEPLSLELDQAVLRS